MQKTESRISRQHILNEFKQYISEFDRGNVKIAVKIKHTFKVADNCDAISDSLGLRDDEKDIAWFIGIVHDIGRFKQIKKYNTFSDPESENHAALSVQVLFDDGMLKKMIDMPEYNDIIYKAVFYHNAYNLPDNLNEKESLYCKIIRDADKIDIFRAIAQTPITDLYDERGKNVEIDRITREVYEASISHHVVLHSDIKNGVDTIVANVSIIYDLVFPKSFEIVKKQGYLNRILEFKSQNDETNEQFARIKEEIEKYIQFID